LSPHFSQSTETSRKIFAVFYRASARDFPQKQKKIEKPGKILILSNRNI